tara:strand:+ start:12280 stop:12975 length:696 start_codon:yes stop_codon:yes gene_type:complete
MKRILILLVVAIGFSLTTSAQFGRTTSVTNRPGNMNIPIAHLRLKTIDRAAEKESEELVKKKYLTYSYEIATVDSYDTKAYVRYNIFDDEMEFVKDESIYYLAKEEGRKVHFTASGFTYKVYELNGDLHFFKLLQEGKNSLVAKQGIRYIDAKAALSGYDRAKPANYKKLKDELYLALEDKTLVKLSKKKNQFFSAFGSKESVMKAYMKKNRLNYKNRTDLEKAVAYFNTL